ncbi:MAG: phosphatidylserine decarboxylase [Gammaproteobacteria bacterium]|nr:phosphatidylserine decarboxylase [Gammaproteobacteria bacterium]
MKNKLLAFLQTVLPHHAISRLTGALARSEIKPLKNLLIQVFLRLYDINLAEAENSDPNSYPSFNAFFTRGLKPGSRSYAAADNGALISPCDGTVSQAGIIDDGSLFQAKGHDYSVVDLLGGDEVAAAAFNGGQFATIYLAPYNYHRIHMPLTARLRAMHFIPGRLFSVSPATARAVSGLFARNERVVFHFESDQGPLVLVMVGAMNVGSIETIHQGIIAPGGNTPRDWQYDPAPAYQAGDELARFNLGSTVILLLPGKEPALHEDVTPGTVLQLGQPLTRY